MQLVLPLSRMAEAAPYMDPKVFRYIHEGQTESFESFETFNLLAFNWYDIHSDRTDDSKVLIYMDRKDLFFLCEDAEAEHFVRQNLEDMADTTSQGNEKLLYHFFVHLLRGDMAYLDQFESEIDDSEAEILAGRDRDALNRIISWRRELLRLKHYYEQLDAIFDEMAANDNDLLAPDTLKRITILGMRTDRYLSKVCNLQEIVSQMREAYQSQLSIQQYDLMKVFTIVTVLFLPLTLLTGWYGMNFIHMPELQWRFSYPVLIAISLVVVLGLVWYFKRKKWL